MPPEITRERLNFSMNRKVKWRILSKKYDRFRDPRTGVNRMYVVWLDRNNLEPTGQIERTFTAPVDIPEKFISFPPDKPWMVELDLDGYARYLKQALADWEIRLREIKAARRADEPEERSLALAGPKPQDWRLVVLMSRGDPWCLGFTDKRTPAVEAIIGKAPTEKELRLERERPKDLRLDPELEALIGKGVQVASPDEVDELDRQLRGADLSVTDEDLEAAGLDPDDLEDGDDQDEDILTGNLDLDDPTLEDDSNDLAAQLEEEIDPKATGGKRENPRKNRRRPARED